MTKIQSEIVIIGAGLTGLTLAYYLAKKGKNIVLLEKDEEVGGVIKTKKENGFVFENGPTTGVLGSEEIVQLFEDLKDDCTLEKTSSIANQRWILKNAKWEPIPSGLMSAVGTPLFKLKDKFKILGEPFRAKGNNPDETLAEMVKRRMGQSFLDYAIDPFISGVYAGDPNQLITRFALPKLYNLEQTYGSFIKGSMKKRKEPKTELQKKVTREVFSVEGGLGELISALDKHIPSESKFCDAQQINVSPSDNGFITSFEKDGDEFEISSDKVVTTIGGYALTNVLSFVEKEDLEALEKVNYAKVLQVAVGYNKWDGKQLNAFGGLIPSLENEKVLGILFPGSLFKNRCPKNGTLLSVFVGGIKKPEMFQKPDQEIKEMVLDIIKRTLEEEKEPDLFHIYRYQHAIPQYDKLSEAKLKAIDSIQKQHKGLFVIGNVRDGIGMADRVKQAVLLADEL